MVLVMPAPALCHVRSAGAACVTGRWVLCEGFLKEVQSVTKIHLPNIDLKFNSSLLQLAFAKGVGSVETSSLNG